MDKEQMMINTLDRDFPNDNEISRKVRTALMVFERCLNEGLRVPSAQDMGLKLAKIDRHTDKVEYDNFHTRALQIIIARSRRTKE